MTEEKWTERKVLNLLHDRYGQMRGNGPRWSKAEHVKNACGFDATRTIDFMATHLWPGTASGRDIAFHAHEVKVSRSDWLTELRDPTKAEAFRPFVHFFWLVVSDRSIVKPGELPADWGLMAPGKDGRLRAFKGAPRNTPDPMPIVMTAALLRATARTAERRVSANSTNPIPELEGLSLVP